MTIDQVLQKASEYLNEDDIAFYEGHMNTRRKRIAASTVNRESLIFSTRFK